MERERERGDLGISVSQRSVNRDAISARRTRSVGRSVGGGEKRFLRIFTAFGRLVFANRALRVCAQTRPSSRPSSSRLCVFTRRFKRRNHAVVLLFHDRWRAVFRLRHAIYEYLVKQRLAISTLLVMSDHLCKSFCLTLNF